MNSKQIKKKFLKGAPDVIDRVMEAYAGESNPLVALSTKQSQLLKFIWPTLNAIITTSGDLQKIDAESKQTILDALKKGKITIEEAEKLLKMISDKNDNDMDININFSNDDNEEEAD